MEDINVPSLFLIISIPSSVDLLKMQLWQTWNIKI